VGVIPLQNAEVTEVVWKNRPNVFELKPSLISKVFYIQAKNAQEMKEWMDILSRAIHDRDTAHMEDIPLEEDHNYENLGTILQGKQKM
jgi:hypothetical protein